MRSLQAEARALAKDHLAALTQAITAVELMAAEITEGGEAYPPDVSDLARRVVDDCGARAQTLEAISSRA